MIVEIRVCSYFLQNVFLRYRQVVTLKRTCIVVAITWIKSTFVAALYPVDFRITISYGCIVIPLCVIVSFVSYTRIFWALRHRSNEVQDRVQHRNSQTNPLNIVRYRKAVNGSLSVQLVLLVCYSPFAVVEISVITNKAPSSSYLWLVTLVFFNSSLNPILYCWKINEVRQAVKQIIRQAFYCPWE